MKQWILVCICFSLMQNITGQDSSNTSLSSDLNSLKDNGITNNQLGSMYETTDDNVLNAPLPAKFDNLKEALMVNHFPQTVYASTDESVKSNYQWKHTTSIMSLRASVTVIEFGAYIFYNNQWNLRTTMKPKQFDKLFDTKKGKLKAGQPYTFKDNWRNNDQLFGGWAMWYFIAINEAGEKVYGVGKLKTVGSLSVNQ